METNNKILIIIRGGVVHSIYSSDENLQFDVLDFDNEGPEIIDEDKELESRSEGLVAIY
jgi:hypothetical protein